METRKPLTPKPPRRTTLGRLSARAARLEGELATARQARNEAIIDAIRNDGRLRAAVADEAGVSVEYVDRILRHGPKPPSGGTAARA